MCRFFLLLFIYNLQIMRLQLRRNKKGVHFIYETILFMTFLNVRILDAFELNIIFNFIIFSHSFR